MRIKLVVFFVVLLFFVMVLPYYTFLTRTLNISIWKTLFTDGGVDTISDTVNIIVLGIPGGHHEGPNLSDSMIVAHYDFKKNTLTTIGIPRDLWSPTLRDKINSAYAYGEAKKKGGGLKLVKAEVAGIIGPPIPYGVTISFDRFTKLIDYLGGIDVNVEHSFIDREFPVTGKENDPCDEDPQYRCRYETISFSKGITHMDGITALKFVRSRHAEGDEGGDFARSRRQQLVINAVKTKVLNRINLLNPGALSDLYNNLNKLVERDITNQQIAAMVKNIILKKNFSQKSFTLSDDLFEVPDVNEYNGKYVLIPMDERKLQDYIACLFEKQDEKKC